MSIYHLTIFICDKCRISQTLSEEVYLYSDISPTEPIEGWDYGRGDRLLCKKCRAEE